MNKVVATIRCGHRITCGSDVYDVIGARKLRGTYFYIVRDCHQQTFSMRRELVLSGLLSGEIRVTA